MERTEMKSFWGRGSSVRNYTCYAVGAERPLLVASMVPRKCPFFLLAKFLFILKLIPKGAKGNYLM
jgi:hypothetical protein